MNRKKLIILYLPVAVLLVVLVSMFLLFSRQTVQKGVMGEEIISNEKWNAIMAESANKSKLSLKVNQREIEVTTDKIYMSKNMNLMLPVSIVKETFNCAENIYNDKRVVIEKGSNIAIMYIGEKRIIFNDNVYKLEDNVVKKKGMVYIPATVFREYFNYKYVWDSKKNEVSMKDNAVSDSYLPERYSYIDRKRAVPVKDQGNYGTCWAFATLTALETALTPEETYDFSENNLIYNNDLSEDIQDGGDYMMSMSYLMAWKGPVLEKDDPYGSQVQNENAECVKHVQEAQILPEKDYKQIKNMVYKYGGVESSMYMSMSNSNMSSVYYNETEYAYCYRGNNKPNHDVVIIGWDDNYSKELFNDQSIEGDGAFICMNSWGSDFGYHGVFYVSYYDSCIGNNNVCYTKVENVDNYKNIYQSDLCGWTGSMGFENENTVYFANVYTAEEDEKLESIGFYATIPDLEYEVFICPKYDGVGTLNERNHIAASGTLKNKGYYTIKLDKKYTVKEDQKFSVIVKATNKKDDKTFKIIPVEMETESMEGTVDLNDGEGYFSAGGLNWQSAENQGCNICLKVYTSK